MTSEVTEISEVLTYWSTTEDGRERSMACKAQYFRDKPDAVRLTYFGYGIEVRWTLSLGMLDESLGSIVCIDEFYVYPDPYGSGKITIARFGRNECSYVRIGYQSLSQFIKRVKAARDVAASSPTQD